MPNLTQGKKKDATLHLYLYASHRKELSLFLFFIPSIRQRRKAHTCLVRIYPLYVQMHELCCKADTQQWRNFVHAQMSHHGTGNTSQLQQNHYEFKNLFTNEWLWNVRGSFPKSLNRHSLPKTTSTLSFDSSKTLSKGLGMTERHTNTSASGSCYSCPVRVQYQNKLHDLNHAVFKKKAFFQLSLFFSLQMGCLFAFVKIPNETGR